jgi:hypothetical protein
MSRFEAPPGIVTNGLVLNLDAGDPDSYTRSQPPFVEVLVVAGGGGGGYLHGGGGGGAGGLIYNSAYQITNASAITVTVGAGGAAGFQLPTNGNNSVFGGLTAIGGGAGGSEVAPLDGSNGGSGGGGSGFSTATAGGTGTAGQGFNGGKGGFPDTNADYGSGGGGGGAGAPGTDGKEGADISGGAGIGGNGQAYSISGTSTYYAGGGGGGLWNSTEGGGGAGGLGGGGTGGSGFNTQPTAGTDNTGGGGGGSKGSGGGAARIGAAGGSGIVIVRYPGLPAATGGTITYLNGYTIHTFTTSGTFTPFLWNDVSGNGNNGTLVNGPTFNQYQWGGTVYIDGTDDYVTVTGTYPTGTNARTVAGWFKSGRSVKVGNADHIINYGASSAAQSFGFMLYTNNQWWFFGFGASFDFTSGVTADTNWHYHCITYNGSTVIYYLDGTSVASASRTLSTTSGGMTLGTRPDLVSGNESQGNLGAVQVYNRALSATEITQNFNAQRARFGL